MHVDDRFLLLLFLLYTITHNRHVGRDLTQIFNLLSLTKLILFYSNRENQKILTFQKVKPEMIKPSHR